MRHHPWDFVFKMLYFLFSFQEAKSGNISRSMKSCEECLNDFKIICTFSSASVCLSICASPSTGDLNCHMRWTSYVLKVSTICHYPLDVSVNSFSIFRLFGFDCHLFAFLRLPPPLLWVFRFWCFLLLLFLAERWRGLLVNKVLTMSNLILYHTVHMCEPSKCYSIFDGWMDGRTESRELEYCCPGFCLNLFHATHAIHVYVPYSTSVSNGKTNSDGQGVIVIYL